MRRLRLLLFALVLSILIAAILPLAAGATMLSSLTHPGCARYAIPDAVAPKLQSITFSSPRGFTLSGFFLPGSNGATVIIVPTMGNDRAGGLTAAEILNGAGFSVLTFDAATCAGAIFHSLGYAEADDVVAAYAYLGTRGDVDTTYVTLHGFSSAGATSLFAAARLPQIRGVSVEGNYSNFAEQLGIGHTGGPLEQLIRLGAALSYRFTIGQDVQQLDLLPALDAIAPRPILFIYGSREVSLPGARMMLARTLANGGNADLWVVEGAGHGGYLQAAQGDYAKHIIEFHREASGL